jgi:carbamoyltransferase
VSERTNPLYYSLIDSFRDVTGVPMVLNTSFNENEPVVCEPRQALDCFLRTSMDMLVMGHAVLYRMDAKRVRVIGTGGAEDRSGEQC